MEILPLLFFAGVAALVIFISSWMGAKRRKELKAWAESRGFLFFPEKDYSVPPHSCFRRGDNRYLYNKVQGLCKDRALFAFDFHYETYSRDSKGRRTTHHHHFSAVVITPGHILKPLKIRTENFFDKVGEFFGFDDIDFESAEFSGKFHVSAPDRKWAYDVLHQESMEFLLRSPRFTLEFQSANAAAFRDSVFSIRDFENALSVLSGLLERLPQSVISELKGDA